MEYTGKIRIFKAEDRQIIAGILSANKYQVWQGSERVGKNKRSFRPVSSSFPRQEMSSTLSTRWWKRGRRRRLRWTPSNGSSSSLARA